MANKFTISTVFNAIDHMTGPIQKMNAKVGMLGDKVNKAGKQFNEKFGNLSKIAGGAMLGIAGAAVAAGAAVFKLATHAQNAADSIYDTSQSLGISTDALQEYRYLAKLSGMETGDMDAALTKLTVNLGKGGTELEGTLSMLGLTVDQLAAVDAGQRLEMIANGMKNVKDGTTKAAITTQLFGKSSVKMVNALSGGSEAIKEFRDEAQKSGYVMDETALKAGVKMGDAMDRLQLKVEGAMNSLGIKFAPVMEKMIAKSVEFISKVGPGLADMAGLIGDVVADAFTSLMPIINTVFEILKPVFSVVSNIMSGLGPVFIMISKALAKALPLIMALAEMISELLIPIFELLMPILEPVFDVLGLIFDILTPIIKVLTAIIKGAILWFKGLSGPAKAIIGILLPFIGIPILLKSAWGPIKDFFSGIWTGITTGATALWDMLTKFWNELPANLMAAWESVGSFFTGLWGGIVETFNSAVRWIMDAIQPVMDMINSVMSGLSYIGIGGGPMLASAPSAPLSSQTSTINRNTTSSSQLDVNFSGAPFGTTTKQTGQVPGINVNMGPVRAR